MHEILANISSWFQSMGVWGLALNSCIESFFLLPPPDFLLIAMDLTKPEKAMFYATICTLASAIGGAIGYAIGFWGGRPAFKFLFKKHIDKNGKKFAVCFRGNGEPEAITIYHNNHMVWELSTR